MSNAPKELQNLIAEHAQSCAWQEAEEERQLWISQVERGKCNVVPFPSVATQPFRSDLSVEQNSLFVANRYKGHCFIREWEVQHPSGSGEPVQKKLTVGFEDPKTKGFGVLTQVHQDVFYKLQELWMKHSYELETNDPSKIEKIRGSFTVSAYELVMAIRGNDTANDYRRVKALLSQMAGIPIEMKTRYTWQESYDKKTFTLLGDVYWEAKNVDEKTGRPRPGGKSEVTICFSRAVTEDYLAKQVKTLLATPYKELATPGRGGTGELAKLLYPYLDSQLAKKTSYHVRLEALLAHFGMATYRYKSKRKEKMRDAFKALQGTVILGGGYVLRLSLREAADGKDYVLVAHKDPANQVPLFEE